MADPGPEYLAETWHEVEASEPESAEAREAVAQTEGAFLADARAFRDRRLARSLQVLPPRARTPALVHASGK